MRVPRSPLRGHHRYSPSNVLCRELATLTENSSCPGPLLGVTPSFMLSGVSPGVYIAAQAIVEYIPVLPSMSLNTELPLALVDGFTRTLLFCSLIPPAVIANTSPAIASSPWTLLLSSLVRHFVVVTVSIPLTSLPHHRSSPMAAPS